MSKVIASEYSRRQILKMLALLTAAAALPSCKRSYVRPGGVHDLGEPANLLYPKQHIRDAAILLHRDDEGWAALSSRCTFDGCDLTFQDTVLHCSCCQSRFAHDGRVVQGPATLPLPWYEIRLEDGHLFADSGKRVDKSYRFKDATLEETLGERRRKIAEEGVIEGIEVPDVLLGHSDGEIGPMFKDYQRDALDEVHSLPSTTEEVTEASPPVTPEPSESNGSAEAPVAEAN